MRSIAALVFAGLFASATASAQTISVAPPNQVARGQVMPATPRMVVVARQPELRGNLGGGFIEFLFGDNASQNQYVPPPVIYPDDAQRAPQSIYANTQPSVDTLREAQSRPLDPQFQRQRVDYQGKEEPGSIVIDTPNHFLYLVEPDGKAMRYGIGVGRPGFTWSGVHTVSSMKEWPDWVPPKEMLQRQPYLPHRMAGGPNNPLGARALYLGSTLYRIHGSNEPWTIGHNVSSGCIRLRNADVIDLYSRVKVGTKVVVL
jgi:lipoprotein-anchoring transpeptidase ErfK/SrfK